MSKKWRRRKRRHAGLQQKLVRTCESAWLEHPLRSAVNWRHRMHHSKNSTSSSTFIFCSYSSSYRVVQSHSLLLVGWTLDQQLWQLRAKKEVSFVGTFFNKSLVTRFVFFCRTADAKIFIPSRVLACAVRVCSRVCPGGVGRVPSGRVEQLLPEDGPA